MPYKRYFRTSTADFGLAFALYTKVWDGKYGYEWVSRFSDPIHCSRRRNDFSGDPYLSLRRFRFEKIKRPDMNGYSISACWGIFIQTNKGELV